MIVDASVAVKWFIDEPGSEAALALITADRPLWAPSLVIAEIGNTFWKLARRGDVDSALVPRIVRTSIDAFERLVPIETLAEPALAIAAALDHPLYDCLYLALAQDANEPLVTADRRLVNAAASTDYAELVVPLE